MTNAGNNNSTQTDASVENGRETDHVNMINHRYHDITQHVSPQTSTDHTYTPTDDVAFYISKTQEIHLTEWETDASPNAS